MKPYMDLAEIAAQEFQNKTGRYLDPNLIWAQWYHETGGFTSELFRTGNNLGGFTTTEDMGDDWRQPDGDLWYRPFSSREEGARFAGAYLANYVENGIADATDPVSYAQALKNGGYYGASVEEYAAGLTSALGVSPDFQVFEEAHPIGPWGETPAPIPEDNRHPSYFERTWEETKDKFIDNAADDGAWAVLRNLWANINASGVSHFLDTYNPSQEEVEMVKRELPDTDTQGNKIAGALAAQEYVLTHASSAEALQELLHMKQEDMQRRARVSQMEYGLSTLGSVVGALFDPVTIVAAGVSGGTALLAKAGKVAALTKKISLLKKQMRVSSAITGMDNFAIQCGTKVALGSAVATTNRWAAKNYGGWEPDYASAAFLGGAIGGAIGLAGRLRKAGVRGKKINALEDTIEQTKRTIVAQAEDYVSPMSHKGQVVDYLSKVNQRRLADGSKEAQELMDANKLFIVSREHAEKLAAYNGISLDKKAVAFTDKASGVSVLLSDKVTPKNIKGLVAHEVGVHQGLQHIMPESSYKQLLNTVQQKMQTSKDPAWQIAAKQADNPEEALAYWVEHSFNKKEKFWQRLKKNITNKEATDEELKDLIIRGVQNEINNKQVVTPLADGSNVVMDIHYSKDNMLTPVHETFMDTKGAVSKENKHWYLDFLGLHFSPGEWLEAGWLPGTLYGKLASSRLPRLREAANILLHDAQMRGHERFGMTQSTEDIKRFMQDRWLSMYNDFVDDRIKYTVKTYGHVGALRNKYINKVNEDIVKCYNLLNENCAALGKSDTLSKYPAEIVSLARRMKAIRKDMMEFGAAEGEKLGGRKGTGAYLSHGGLFNDDEFYRIVDMDKMYDYVGAHYYGGAKGWDKFQDMLTDYARRNANRKVIREQLEHKAKQDFDIAKLQYNSKPHGPKDVPPVKTDVTDEAVDAWIEENAKDWAFGIKDRHMSDMEFMDGDVSTFRDSMGSFNHRFPMDTSAEMDIGNGVTFCFDRDMRDFDIDKIMPQMINRMSGDVALHATFGEGGTKDFLDTCAQELEKSKHILGKGGAERQKDALRRSIQMIRGVGDYNTADMKNWNLLSNMIRKHSYANVGGNMTFAQTGEIGSMVAYSGFHSLLSGIPVFGKTLARGWRHMSNGELASIAEAAEKHLKGESIATKAWHMSSSMTNRAFSQTMAHNDDGSRTLLSTVADSAYKWTHRESLLTSTVNQMTKLTDAMEQESRISAITDLIDWANGKTFSAFRNPVSAKKLKAAGVSDTISMKRDIKKYLDVPQDQVAASMDKWMQESPDTFTLWRQLVRNQSLRSIQQQTIGNTGYLKDANWFTKLFFQFKDFTFRTINGQMMRALQSHEVDDGMALMFSMGTNAMTYYGLTVARGYAMYPNDTAKRDAFFDRNLTPQRLALAGLTRASFMSILSVGTDVAEMFTDFQGFRTTVDNTYKAPRSDMTVGGKFGKFLGQAPAAGVIDKTTYGTIGAYNLATHQGDTRDFDNLMRSLPLGSWWAMVGVSSLIKDNLNLKKPRPKKVAPKKREHKQKGLLDKLKG
nr:MAG TPA: Internal virion protein D [Caudoviricetes sp.]